MAMTHTANTGQLRRIRTHEHLEKYMLYTIVFGCILRRKNDINRWEWGGNRVTNWRSYRTYKMVQLGINWINDAGTRRSRRCWTSRFKRKLNVSWEVRMISTGEIEMRIEQRILANLQDGWTFMPRLYFFSQRPTFSSILFYQPTTIVSHRAPNLDVISNHNWVLIESTTSKKCLYPIWNHWCVVFLVFY